ncbi:MAG: endonuclease III [Thermodesulfovibrio sp.]|nr:endonuclease III [Thermodesulfovibrio sp.]
MESKKRLLQIIRKLKKEYPQPRTALNFSSPFELLVATIMSAQTTDAQVNRVTSVLFNKYTTIKAFADAPIKTLQKDISSVNFFNNKAKNIQASAQMLLREFNGNIPQTMAEIIRLPGVARKTGNIVLSTIYGVNEGIAVDTHVMRLSQRLGLSTYADPVRIERDLMELTPQKEWANLSHLLVLHGRNICQARKPKHAECVLRDICPSKDL